MDQPMDGWTKWGVESRSMSLKIKRRKKVKKNKVKAKKGDIKERHTWKQRRDELKKKKKQ